MIKEKIIQAISNKTFWLAFTAFVGGILMQLGLVDLGQQFNAIMGLVITFIVGIGLVHDNGASKQKEDIKEDE